MGREWEGREADRGLLLRNWKGNGEMREGKAERKRRGGRREEEEPALPIKNRSRVPC